MNKKLFAFDLDGTLLVENKYILKESIEAIKKARAKGHAMAISTGRPFSHIKEVEHVTELFDYFICNNGTYIYDVKNDKFIYSGSVPQKVIDNMIKIGEENQSYIILHGKLESYKALLNNKKEQQWDLNELKEIVSNTIIPNKEELIEKNKRQGHNAGNSFSSS